VIAPFLMLALSVAQVPPYSETGKLTDGPPSGPSKWYRDLVERYLTGDREGAIAEEFPPEKALYEINAVARLVTAARRTPTGAVRHQLDTFSFPAAVLLHTDRAFAMLERYDPAFTAELELPPRLIAIMDEEPRRALEPRWVRATALELSHQAQWDLALTMLDPVLKRYPDDPLLLLAKGAVLESKSRLERETTVEYQRVTSFGLRRDRMNSGPRELRGRLQSAEACYRQALAARPELIQARVRLGRVLQLLDRGEDSIAELQAVVAAGGGAGPPAARDLYLAHLFLGSAHETAGRLDRAAAEYEQAVRALPEGQAAAVALSHALHRLGRGSASVEALESGVAQAGRRQVLDPWWPYLAGEFEDPEALFADLRAGLTP
jgi:tetratricopeptide (TPR) repeat protein